ncbi:MAG: YMGG-like glycine zipper-containing protein [Verrucomicrobia bacterium]|jgi:hypothetical protein|nr:YMGG-like glycine zipper-containing protein [Verrucomicrobiota bacterium]
MNRQTMKAHPILITTLTVLAALHLQADVLELKDGKTMNGKYVGGTAGTIRFETSAGVQVIETGQALALTFTAPAPAAASAAPAPAAPAPQAVTIPAGTALLVRLVDPVSSKDPQGKRFTTTLDANLTVNGTVVAKAGTKVYGRVQSAQQARRYAGQSQLDLRLTEIAVGPNLVPLVTSGYSAAGAKSMQKTARGAAAGAAIGAIANDDDAGEGAAKGAAIGAVASGVKKGETVSVTPGTLLEFSLQQPLTVNLVP